MMEANELIVFLIGAGVLFFFQINSLRLRKGPFMGILLAAFGFMLGGWFLSIVEGFFFKEAVNFFEHICYSMSSIMLALWFFKMSRPRERRP